MAVIYDELLRHNGTMCQRVEARRHIYASMSCIITGSSIRLSPLRRQAITRTNDDMISIGPLGKKIN